MCISHTLKHTHTHTHTHTRAHARMHVRTHTPTHPHIHIHTHTHTTHTHTHTLYFKHIFLQVHIGRRERLSLKDYNSIVSSKSPAQCEGNTILFVFTEPILLRSTISGNISNKTIGKDKQNNNKETKLKLKADKLDEKKLQACQGNNYTITSNIQTRIFKVVNTIFHCDLVFISLNNKV